MISLRDMTDMIYVYDAYCAINRALFGEAVFFGFSDGNWGTMTRMFNVIERNVADELKKDNFKEAKAILDSSLLTPEERARKLLGE